MRRIVIVGTAVAVLVGAGAAYAAFYNGYTGSKLTFAPKVAGSKAHPVAIKETEYLTATAPAGDRAAPLTDIRITIYGVKTRGGKLPKCTGAQIDAAGAAGGYDKACPAGSLIAQGPVHSLLGPGTDPSASSGTACNPYLHVYNGGAHSQVFFFTTDATHQCAGLVTGQTAPYFGTISHSGLNWTLDVALPPDISTKVANVPGLYGSLITEDLVYKRSTHYMDSIACGVHHKRPYSIRYTDTDYNGASVSQTIKGTSPC